MLYMRKHVSVYECNMQRELNDMLSIGKGALQGMQAT